MRIIATLAFFLSCSHLFSQTTLFVNQNVSGGQQNGNNWSNAFPDLQQALAVAVEGNAIWVAAGTYYPTNSTDRTISFVLKQGVKIFGGFIGTETNLGQRDFLLNETILSGDIGAVGPYDNSYHVILGMTLDSTTVLDGLVVANGRADGNGDDNSAGGGLLLRPSPVLYNTCPIIQNCRFEMNFAWVGGGIAANRNHFSQNYVNPIIRNCQFLHNSAKLGGGGLLKGGPSIAGQPLILEDCIFAYNSCYAYDAGGVYVTNFENDIIVRRCVFEGNTAGGFGGGLYFWTGYELHTGGSLLLESCIFKDNKAAESGGFFATSRGVTNFSTPPCTIKLSGCTFEGNISKTRSGSALSYLALNRSTTTFDILNCDFIENLSDSISTIYMESIFGVSIKLNVKGSKFVGNKHLTNPDEDSFSIYGALGENQLGVFDAVVENCLFSKNGGGVSFVCTEDGGQVKAVINNCTFSENTGLIFNKSYYPDFNGIDKYVTTNVSNCVIWEPEANLWTMFADNDTSINTLDGYHVHHCLLSLDSFEVTSSPVFGFNNITHHNPLFVDAANSDLRLKPCSPAVNAGDNAVVDTLNVTDLYGNPRIAHDTVDMGAYEVQDSCFVSGSYEPPESEDQAMIFPNPVPAGQRFEVKASGFSSPETHWIIWDMKGAEISTGTELLAKADKISLSSPKIPGIYFLKLWDRDHAVVLKFEAL